MNVPPNQKMCPRCLRRWLLSAPFCPNCGYQFGTWFSGKPGAEAAAGAAAASARNFKARAPDPVPGVQMRDEVACPTARFHGGSHVVVALFLGILFPGLGIAQLYNGQFQKAGAIVMAQILAGLAAVVAFFVYSSPSEDLETLARIWVAAAVAWPLMALILLNDAVTIAARISRGEQVGEWQWF